MTSRPDESESALGSSRRHTVNKIRAFQITYGFTGLASARFRAGV